MSNRPRPPTRHATPTCRNAKQRRRFRLIRREHTQSPCGQAGPRAAGNHDLEVMACMVQQVRQRVDHRCVADPVPIVDDDVEMCSARLDFVDERGHNLAFGFLAAAFELMPKSLTRRGPHAANGIDQVGENHTTLLSSLSIVSHATVVPSSERTSRHCAASVVLTEPRGPVDQRQSPVAAGPQQVDQPRADDM